MFALIVAELFLDLLYKYHWCHGMPSTGQYDWYI